LFSTPASHSPLVLFGHSALPPPRGGSASRVSPQSCQSHEFIDEVCQTHRVNVRIPVYLWSTSSIGILHLCMCGPSDGMNCTDVFLSQVFFEKEQLGKKVHGLAKRAGGRTESSLVTSSSTARGVVCLERADITSRNSQLTTRTSG